MQKNSIVLYPTDTVWGIGCNATCEKAVAKVFNIKRRAESKSLIILVDGIEYAIKSILKFVPFARNIFLVTDNQIPNFLIDKKDNGAFEKL